jgi:CO/xanthine dehydrogenase FAD-binding subunit
MIPFDFEYYRPRSVQEAVELHRQLSLQGKQPLYYSGGTEIITLGRIQAVHTGAVIDIKSIPECRMASSSDGQLTLGSALTLNEVTDSGLFPLLGETSAEIADRTSRNKITLGGNLCGRFMYREAVLPLLLAECAVELATASGGRIRVPIHQVFQQYMRLNPGELLLKVIIDERYVRMPYVTIKRRKQAAIDYPLVTIAAIQSESGIRLAFSGVCDFPFRSLAIEEAINRPGIPVESRVELAVSRLPAPIRDDIKGSADYRKWVLMNTLLDVIVWLEGGGGAS